MPIPLRPRFACPLISRTGSHESASAIPGRPNRINPESNTAVAAILYRGFIASGAGYLLYNLSIREIGPTRTASVVYGIVPIAVAILAFFIFHEPITLVTVSSMALIVAALRLVLVSAG